MAFEDVIEKVSTKAATIPAIGKSLRINLGEDIIYIDGTGEENKVSSEDKEADCVVSLNEDTLNGLASGSINPMMAVMSGKVKIKGDISVAMKLQSLLGK
jgi:putative sterol carrier protein